MKWDRLYDEVEQVNVRFVGVATEYHRYDFAIMYTNMFFGKALVTCMQTGRSTLLCLDDTQEAEAIQKAFHIKQLDEAEQIGAFLQGELPPVTIVEQY
ncbi:MULTISPECIES: DUF3055 domain-containing protein [Alteribacter]|uniref:DUF3055 domain-containing protein n=1 Tax=Alteribacter keqinensis TaxID=2483800 RepID=A0A3M7TWD8_9BACI|nr:DUF3055 domain-containing protein [Alteribacter keqinensis]MBM7095976.1 DUF3055 domain-containing protein [Alteribacter salitolerans]RNA69793.1 DUF3055 domain-containing protein [Alteribacter keqinensis]